MSAVWSRDGAGADEDLWDDTELIRAYDEAVRSFKKSQGKDGEQADAGRASSGDSDQVGVEKRTKSPDAPGALNAEQPRPKRVKPLAAKKPAAQAQAPAVPVAAEAQAGNASSGAAASDAAAQQAYWQTVRREDRTPTHAWQQYYAQQAAWYPQQAVAPSYFAPSISAPLPPVQDEALNQLLTAWYNAGYQAGRYQALRGAPS